MAKEHPRYADTEWPDYEYREFPMMYYPGAKDQKKPYGDDGKPLKGILVQNEAEFAEVRAMEAPAETAADVSTKAPATPPKAAQTVPTSTKGVDRVKNADDDRAELITEADQLGVTVDKSWSIARLQDAIDTFKQERDQPAAADVV